MPDPENDAMPRTSARILPALLILVVLTVASQLLSLAYNSEHPFVAIWFPSLIALSAVTMPLAALGLRLGRDLGLGAPLISAWIAGRVGSGQRFLRDGWLALTAGLGLGLFLLLLRMVLAPYLPPELPELGHRGPLGGLLASVSAAIGEEVWLRLGVMTTLAWLLVRVRGRSGLDSGSAWTAILAAALLFGAIHLPQLASADAANPAGILGTMFGNTLVGVLCGWLYWQRSLVAAIVAHFSVDVVLHVLPAFLG